MPIHRCVDQSPDLWPYQDVKKGQNQKRVRLQVFLRLEGRKSCKWDFTAVDISGMPANAGFPPLGAEENWQMDFTAYENGGKAARCPIPFQAAISISFNTKLAEH